MIDANTLKEWKLACPKGELDLVFPNGKGNVEDHLNMVRRGLIPPQLAAGTTIDTGKKVATGKPIVVANTPGCTRSDTSSRAGASTQSATVALGSTRSGCRRSLGHSSTMTMDV